MSSVAATQVPGLVTDAGYRVMVEAYDAIPTVRDIVAQVVPIDITEQSEGDTEVVIVGDMKPTETARGADAPARTLDEGYQWFCRFRKYQERMVLTEEMMAHANARAMITSRVASIAGKAGAGFATAKEELLAGMFNNGSLAAGSLADFNGSYPGHADAYPKFIYDGKPWFATAGNGHPLWGVTSVTKVNHDANALNAANLEAARILMMSTNAVDEFNDPIRIDPDVLLVPPDLEQTADVLLTSAQTPGSANNDANTMRGRFSRVTWRYLTDTNGWFLGTRGRGIRFYDSGVPMIYTSAPDPASGSITIRFVSYAGAVVTDWRYWTAHNTTT